VNREACRSLHEVVKISPPIEAIFSGNLASDPNTVEQGACKLIPHNVKRTARLAHAGCLVMHLRMEVRSVCKERAPDQVQR
jgi:hypothetical protein